MVRRKFEAYGVVKEGKFPFQSCSIAIVCISTCQDTPTQSTGSIDANPQSDPVTQSDQATQPPSKPKQPDAFHASVTATASQTKRSTARAAAHVSVRNHVHVH